MKAHLTVAALSATAALSSTACAQSSVTLFGVVDLGLRHVRNGDASVTSLASSGNNTSRFGLRGAEALDMSLSHGRTQVAPVLGDDGFTTTSGGAAYDFGPLKLSGYCSQSRIASGRVTNTYIGGQVPLGRGMVRASYIQRARFHRHRPGGAAQLLTRHIGARPSGGGVTMRATHAPEGERRCPPPPHAACSCAR
jgi:predicted porin